jgi:hypothetical protein
MAGFLYIAEFAEKQIGPAGRVGQLSMQAPIAEQVITLAVGSTQSNAFNSKTRAVRLHNDGIQPIAVEFGTNPTAVAASASGTARMTQNQTEYFGVPLNQAFKVAAIIST